VYSFLKVVIIKKCYPDVTPLTCLFEKELKVNENENTLKGQMILAQGIALVIRANRKIVREITFMKEKFVIRTKKKSSCFPKMKFCIAVRKE